GSRADDERGRRRQRAPQRDQSVLERLRQAVESGQDLGGIAILARERRGGQACERYGDQSAEDAPASHQWKPSAPVTACVPPPAPSMAVKRYSAFTDRRSA